MASAASRDAYPAFVLQLTRSLTLDVLSAELDAQFSPADLAKKAALDKVKSDFSERVAALTERVSRLSGRFFRSLETGFVELLQAIWRFIRMHPRLSDIETSFLSASPGVEALCAVFVAARELSGSHTKMFAPTNSLMIAVFQGIGNVRKGPPMSPEKMARLAELVEWWSEEVVLKRWGVPDAWGPCTISSGVKVTPLDLVAGNGLAALIPLALKNGCPPNGDFFGPGNASPAYYAAIQGFADVLDALVEGGLNLVRPYEKDGWPLIMHLFEKQAPSTPWLVELVLKRPEVLSASATRRAPLQTTLLEAAIRSGSTALVGALLDAGIPLQYRCEAVPGEMPTVHTSLGYSLMCYGAEVTKLLITKGKALDGWKDKYDEKGLASISTLLAERAVSAFPKNPTYTGSMRHVCLYSDMECVDLVLAAGMVCPWNASGHNSLLVRLYPSNLKQLEYRCIVAEDDALTLLKKFHGAGFDVCHWVASEVGSTALQLQHLAVGCGQLKTLDWALKVVGPPAEADPAARFDTPLGMALHRHNIAAATLLLEHGAKAAYPGAPIAQQPVMLLMDNLERYTDSEAQKMFSALLDRCPDLFGPEYFSERAVADYEDKFKEVEGRAYWNPFFKVGNLEARMARTLEALLKRNPPGLAAMANWPETHQGRRITPAQFVALKDDWATLALLLRYTDARVTDSFDRLMSVQDVVKREAGTYGGPSRAFVATVEARARKELAEKAAAENARRAAVGATTNAFEEPFTKVLTEREQKKKAKKKAGKKKARAKKRAAGAHAGAGSSALAADEDGDSSSDDDEEEPDDNLVDSRYAPSLDALLEEMRLKAEAEGKAAGAGAGGGAARK